MPVPEKTPAQPKVDHAAKLAHWIRNECKKSPVNLDATIASGLKDGAVKLEESLKKNCGISHPDLKIAIANTIKAIG